MIYQSLNKLDETINYYKIMKYLLTMAIMLIGLTFATAGPLRENSPPGIYATENQSVAPAINAGFTFAVVPTFTATFSDVSLEKKGGLESRIEYSNPIRSTYSEPFNYSNGDYINKTQLKTINPNEVNEGYLTEPHREQARVI